jgi:curved DNA-binding protein CbpA
VSPVYKLRSRLLRLYNGFLQVGHLECETDLSRNAPSGLDPVDRRAPPMDNIFIRWIDQGIIRNLDDLKKTYRRIVMKTHPDAVGSDRLVEQYIECRTHYEQAKVLLENSEKHPELRAAEEARDYRLLFYQEFYRLEMMDKPYAFNKYYFSREQINLSKQRAREYFCKWQQDRVELYEQANRIYDQIKLEKPRGPYRKHALLFNLSPVFHNILSYQLTGLQFYRKQLKQNFAAVLFQLEQRQFHKLVEFIEFLIADLEHGPAIHGSD